MKPDKDEQDAIDRLKEWEPRAGKPGGPASQVVTAVAIYTELGGAATRVDRSDGVRLVGPGVLQPSGDESSPRTAGPVQQDATNRGGPRHHGPPAGLRPLPTRMDSGVSWQPAGVSAEKPRCTAAVGGVTGTPLVGIQRGPEHQVGGTHYQRLNPEPIEVIESWGLGYNLGNVIKYVARAGHKHSSTATEDLTKARWYINRALAALSS